MIRAGWAALHGSGVVVLCATMDGLPVGRLQGGPGTPEQAARGHWETRDTSGDQKENGSIRKRGVVLVIRDTGRPGTPRETTKRKEEH